MRKSKILEQVEERKKPMSQSNRRSQRLETTWISCNPKMWTPLIQRKMILLAMERSELELLEIKDRLAILLMEMLLLTSTLKRF